MKKHTIPTLLETEDRILFGLTAKQVMVLAVGLGCSYTLWGSYPEMQASTLGFVLLLAFAGIPSIIAVLIAFVRLAGQPLDEWCMVWLFYMMSPRVYTREFSQEKPIRRSGRHREKDDE